MLPDCEADILVSDIGLPDMDGYDLMQQVRRMDAKELRGDSRHCPYGLRKNRRSHTRLSRRIPGTLGEAR